MIGREKIRRYTETRDVLDFLEALNATARFVVVRSRFRAVKEDPKDDVILASAFDGKADYIVSGDRHLLQLKRFKGIKIVTVAQALNALKK